MRLAMQAPLSVERLATKLGLQGRMLLVGWCWQLAEDLTEARMCGMSGMRGEAEGGEGR